MNRVPESFRFPFFLVVSFLALAFIPYLYVKTPADQPRLLCVFNKKQVYQVKVSAGGTRRLKLNYRDHSKTQPSPRETWVDAVKISFQPRPLNAIKDEVPEDFSFFGLKGDFAVYIDPDIRLPVQISGRISAIGKLNIQLVAVDFNLIPKSWSSGPGSLLKRPCA